MAEFLFGNVQSDRDERGESFDADGLGCARGLVVAIFILFCVGVLLSSLLHN